MINIRLITFSLLFVYTSIYASNMYNLSGIKKVYPVIEIMTKNIPQSYKKIITEETITTLDDAGINHDGYDQVQ